MNLNFFFQTIIFTSNAFFVLLHYNNMRIQEMYKMTIKLLEFSCKLCQILFLKKISLYEFIF